MMKTRVALLLLTAVLVGGCSGGDRAPDDRHPTGGAGGEGSSADVARAQELLDAGDVPGAVEPLRRAASADSGLPPQSREETEFLLTQAEAATREETAEARIAEMKDPVFEAYVERGELPRIPYFHDPRVDEYFRKVLLSKRAEAREIRARRRGR